MSPEDTIEHIHAREAKDGFEALSSSERVVFLIATADFEVNLGGVAGYLYNSAGDRLPQVGRAFSEIGCVSIASSADRLAGALIHNGAYPSREMRHDLVSSADDDLLACLQEFETAVQDQLDDYGSALVSYVEARFPPSAEQDVAANP